MSSIESSPQSKRFEFIRRLSANSLAEGWETTVRGNGRRRFVKIPARQSELSIGEQVKALMQSYRLQGRIRFDGVLRAVDCHRQGGNCFVEYPFLDACDYRTWLPERWTSEQTMHLAEAALTIDLLHALGLVHCDLKLENFGLRRRGQCWYPTLIDLDFLWEIGMRRPAWIAGTPGRIAPEMVEGGELSARTDLYSFGQSLRALVENSGFESEPDDSDRLKRLIELLSDPSPERRPSSMLEALCETGFIDTARFAQLQKRLLAARLVTAFRTERRNIKRGGFDPQKKIFFPCAVCSIPDDFVQDLVDAFVVRPQFGLDVFREFWRAAEVDQFGDFWQVLVPDDVLVSLYEKLAACRRLDVAATGHRKSPDPVHPVASLREYLFLRESWRAGQYLEAEPEARRKALDTLSSLATRLRRPAEAVEYMQALLALLSPDDPRYLETAQRLVVQLFAAGRREDGEVELNRARLALGESRPAAVRVLDRVGIWLLTTRGKVDEASQMLSRIVDEAQAHAEIGTLIKAIGNQGALARQRGELELAMRLFAECRRLALEHNLMPEIGHVLGNYAGLCYHVGDYQRCLRLAKEVEDVSTAGEQPYLKRSSYVEQAAAYTRLGEYQKAEHWLGMLLNETHRQSGPLAYAVYYNNVGWLNGVRCNTRPARRNLEQARVLAGRAGSMQLEATVNKNLAYLALMEGDGDECARHIQVCLDLARKSGDPTSVREAGALQALNAELYGEPSTIEMLTHVIEDLVQGYCLSYAGLFYLQALVGREDEIGREARRAVNPTMRSALTGQGPISEAVRLCLEADDCGDDSEGSFQKLKAALSVLEAAEHKFTSALLCERLADSMQDHNHPKLANRFLAHARTLAAGLSNNVLVARVAAKADERSRLTYEKSALLETIDGVSNIVENLDNYPNALENIVRFAVRATEAERGVLLTRESREAPLQVRAYINFEPDALLDVQDFSRSIASTALNSGKPFMVGDALSDERTRMAKSILMHNVRSVICVPIVSHEHVDAVIYLDHHTIPALFDHDDVKFIRALSRFLSVVLRTARDQKSAEARLRYYEEWAKANGRSDDFLTVDPVTLDLLDKLPAIAESRTNVLLRGENGTGKEILCKKIHDLSGRGDGPLVVLDCSNLTESLVESQLFGIVDGTATGVKERMGKFEAADGGTLFLDEVGELPLQLQSRLLRVLEYRKFERVGSHKTIEVDVRFVFATNRNLEEMVQNGQFRQDLYYRISVISLEIPPLRERIDDISLLADHFARIPAKDKKGTVTLSDRALTYLEAYSWPGNVRELSHVLEGLRIFWPGQTIGVKQLPKEIVSAFKQSESDGLRSSHAERRRMDVVLQRADGNVAEAAREFGMPLTTFRRKMKKHGIKPR